MPSVIVVGGGLAGLSAAAALGSAGFEVDLFEARPFLGGRASSFPLDPADPDSPRIDNCQHVLLGCCVNLLDFYRRLGVDQHIRFFREYYFVEPGGRMSVMRPGPLHITFSFLRLRFLNARDKAAVVRALGGVRTEWLRRSDLDSITMLDWLCEKRQTPNAIARFWRPLLVSAVNEELDRMAARHGIQVCRLAFLAGGRAHEMGIPAAPLSELYRADRLRGVRVHLREPVERIAIEEGRAQGADYVVLAVPFERVCALAPELGLDVSRFEHSPITGIHLFFDRPVMDLPQAVLFGRTIQWAFNKDGGRYVQAVVSASRRLVEMSRAGVIELALAELGEFFPRVREARLEKACVIKEVRATFSARPGLDALRPFAHTRVGNLFLAGDWTCTGWPATMEGAVRSGYLAAEAVTEAAGGRREFLVE